MAAPATNGLQGTYSVSQHEKGRRPETQVSSASFPSPQIDNQPDKTNDNLWLWNCKMSGNSEKCPSQFPKAQSGAFRCFVLSSQQDIHFSITSDKETITQLSN